MDTNEIISKHEKCSDDELTQVVVGDYDLTQAILVSHPQMSQDAGFELFDVSWARRYWRNIIAEIKGINLADVAYSWVINASIENVAQLLIDYYNLPTAAFSAAVALAIIIIRAASASQQEEHKS